MEEAGFLRIWEHRWRLGTWLLPSLIVVVFADQAVIPLASRIMDTQEKIVELQENKYEATWFDSTQLALTKEVTALKNFKASRERALTADSSIQSSIDHLRGLAQHTGIEITKTTPILSKVETLRLLKIQLEGYAHYADLIEFMDSLHVHHSNLFLEEMLLRQSGERSANRLETHLVLYEYDRNQGERP